MYLRVFISLFILISPLLLYSKQQSQYEKLKNRNLYNYRERLRLRSIDSLYKSPHTNNNERKILLRYKEASAKELKAFEKYLDIAFELGVFAGSTGNNDLKVLLGRFSDISGQYK